ncbi:MAG: A/G-specific adenine glycosylase [Burkholderiaceae bacterium]
MKGTAPAAIAPLVIEWQRQHGRKHLPWQGQRDPYRVWLSEVMLQQTQVATVLGYFARFVERFPDVDSLAAASADEVLALWSGLGYYSRARNLHACAQAVVREHGGRFPSSSAELARLPGIGRSTAAAIAAFCFGEPAAILDGNVKRVLTRVLGFDADLARAASERALWAQAQALLPERGIEAYTQGLMDLGASVCSARAPQCPACPLRSVCVAAREGTPERYPVKTRTLVRGRRENVWLWMQWRGSTWLLRRPNSGIWAGLWSLPEFASREALEAASTDWPGHASELPSFTHTLTHLDWTLHPLHWTVPARIAASRVAAMVDRWPQGRWMSQPEALAAGLPAPLRRLLTAPV